MLVPLRRRPIDWLLLGFFGINLGFITYIVDIEQLTVPDAFRFDYPLWPPHAFVDLVHWWGRNFDPLLMARPPWWRATIWLDSILFGPFYAIAIWAIVKGKEWIRIPAIFWAGIMFANVSIIMFEELLGPHRSPAPFVVTIGQSPVVDPTLRRDVALRPLGTPVHLGRRWCNVKKRDFHARYGRVAVVAGASEGLGAAFAEALAARGLDLVLLARREHALRELATNIERRHRVSVRSVACDLKDASFVDGLRDAVANQDVGLAIYNAAFSVLGPLLDRPLDDALRIVDVNVKGPLRMVHALAPAMRRKRRGGIILMSSIAGFQGAPRLAAYAASKAWNIVLGESLWAELRPEGVDVLVSCAGAIRTPNYQRTLAKEAPGTLASRIVAERTLDALGSGPAIVPGAVNKIATFVLGRLLPRANAVAIMDRSTRSLEDPP